jgi:hypothetical protein
LVSVLQVGIVTKKLMGPVNNFSLRNVEDKLLVRINKFKKLVEEEIH